MKIPGAAVMAAAGLLAAAGAAEETDFSGPARAVDGDTLEIGGERVRLFGIDAPELGQSCARRGRRVECGREAARALAWAVEGRTVRCRRESRDRYGRTVASCAVGQGSEAVDLGLWLVHHGAALAARRHSRRYVKAEEAARARESGVWGSDFELPWEYRARTKQQKGERR